MCVLFCYVTINLLRGGFGVHESGEELHIKWIHFAKSRQDLSYGATKDYYLEVLKKCHPTARESIEKSCMMLMEEINKCFNQQNKKDYHILYLVYIYVC